jgi:transposase
MTEKQDTLPLEPETLPVTVVNGRCLLRETGGMRAVLVNGIPVFHYAAGDKAAEAMWMVQGIESGWVKPGEVASALAISRVTVYRNCCRFERSGAEGLVGKKRGPKGARLGAERETAIRKWHEAGMSASAMASQLGVSHHTVVSAMRRMGLAVAAPRGKASTLPLLADDANSSETANEFVVAGETPEVEPARDEAASSSPEPAALTLDTDATDRSVDRALAAMGLLEDAVPLFASGTSVPKAGVLLAIPAVVASGVYEAAKCSYKSLGSAFYGLRTMLSVLVMLALLRVKRAENLKEYAPAELGRVLGLDRVPEVKTLRRKLGDLTERPEALDAFLSDVLKRRVAARSEALGYLYVDGHVRVYSGKEDLPKAHVARMRLSMPATQDVWVNDAEGQPLFFVTQEAHPRLVSALPGILKQAREVVGDRRVTVVFDRGGWSPTLFAGMHGSGFDVLTYRKGTADPVPEADFREVAVPGSGERQTMMLHEAEVKPLGPDGFWMRQITRLKDGHQTQILTTIEGVPAAEVAVRMFDRWRQENFFKYMRQEYAMDALVEYGTESADGNRLVPNPARKAVEADLRKARAEVTRLEAALGAAALTNDESRRRTIRGFKIANGAGIGIPLRDARERVGRLVAERNALPERVPVGSVKSDVVRLPGRRKRLTDAIKMLAYQAESDLVAQVAPFYKRNLDEGRRLVLAALQSTAAIEVTDRELRVTLAPQSSPHRSRAIAELCRVLNDTDTRFPGSNLRLRYAVRMPKEGATAA